MVGSLPLGLVRARGGMIGGGAGGGGAGGVGDTCIG
jgi:hypothetical protein